MIYDFEYGKQNGGQLVLTATSELPRGKEGKKKKNTVCHGRSTRWHCRGMIARGRLAQ